MQGDWTIDLDPARPGEVEVTFTALDDDHTTIRLEHRRIENHGDSAPGVAIGVASPGGWTVGLARLTDVLEGRAPRRLPA